MPTTFKEAKEISSRLIRQNVMNVKKMIEQDRMFDLDWELSPALSQLGWIKKRVSSQPHNNYRNAAALFSGVNPRIRISTLDNSDQSKEKIDKIERGMMWEFLNAAERNSNLLYEIMLQALMYDQVCMQIVYLPYIDEETQAFAGEENRKKAAFRYGSFSLIMRDPKNTFAEFSHYMMERVVSREKMTAQECVDFWGDEARGVAELLVNHTGDSELWVTVYDYHDFGNRYVWAVTMVGDTYPDANTQSPDLYIPDDAEAGEVSIEIKEFKNDLPFIPWAVERGGKNTVPLLSQLYDIWKDINLTNSLLISEVIAYSAAPRFKVEGPSDNIDIDYGEPARPAYVPPGHDIEPLQPPALDQALAAINQGIEGEFDSGALPRVLQGDVQSGAAFATVNLSSQSAVKKLNPYKQVGQRAIVTVFKKMMFWLSHTGDKLEVYPEIEGGDGVRPQQYEINPADWDVEHLYITCELVADTPVDRVSQINAANLAINTLEYTQEAALEQIGVTNPTTMIKDAREEKRKRALDEIETMALVEEKRTEIETDKKIKHAATDIEIARMQEEFRKEMAANAQKEERPPGPGGGGQNGQPSLQDAMRNQELQAQAAQNRGSNRGALEELTGAGFDTANGGSSVVEGAPAALPGGGGTEEAQARAVNQTTAIQPGRQSRRGRREG